MVKKKVIFSQLFGFNWIYDWPHSPDYLTVLLISFEFGECKAFGGNILPFFRADVEGRREYPR
jgi:hypothetical protein